MDSQNDSKIQVSARMKAAYKILFKWCKGGAIETAGKLQAVRSLTRSNGKFKSA